MTAEQKRPMYAYCVLAVITALLLVQGLRSQVVLDVLTGHVGHPGTAIAAGVRISAGDVGPAVGPSRPSTTSVVESAPMGDPGATGEPAREQGDGAEGHGQRAGDHATGDGKRGGDQAQGDGGAQPGEQATGHGKGKHAKAGGKDAKAGGKQAKADGKRPGRHTTSPGNRRGHHGSKRG